MTPARLRWREALPLLALAFLSLVLFGPALLGRGVFFQRDVLSYWRPQIDSLTRVVAEGSLPVWNPYFEMGLPLLADPGYQVYYPPQWANVLLAPDTFYALFIAGHAFFAAAGAFALGRAWRLTPAAALAFGSAWLLSGPFLSLAANNPQFAGAAWIPWVLLGLERTLARPSARAAALLGAAAALQLLAGSGDFALMTAQLAAARLALWVVRGPGSRLDRVAVAARVAPMAGAFALVLAAALWMPTLSIVKAGGRAHMDPSLSAYWSVHPASLADLFVPTALAGLPLTVTARETIFEGREPFLPSLYVGVAAAVLAVLGLRASRARGLLLLVLAVALAATALGRHGVVHAWVLKLPGASFFRYPVKYLVPAALAWAALAGFGMDIFEAEWSAGRQRATRALGVAAMVIVGVLAWGAHTVMARPEILSGIAVDLPTAAAGLSARLAHSAMALGLGAILLILRSRSPRAHPVLISATVLLVIGDLLLAARSLNPLAPPELMQQKPALLQSLAARPDGFATRVLSRVEPGRALNERVVRGPAGWDREWSFALGLIDQLAPATGARWGLGGAYDGDFTGLAPSALSAYSGVLRHPRAGRLAVNLLRAGGVDYVVSLDRDVYGLPEVASVPSVYDAPVRLFRVPDPAPRVYLARARLAAAEYKAWEELADPSFEPGREIVIVGEAPSPAVPSPPPTPGLMAVTARRADRVEIEAELPAAAYAVLTQMRAPGWTASVDGAAVPLLTANLLFCAAAVPEGRHRIVFEYRAPGARTGLLVTIAGLAALAAVFLHSRAARGLPSPLPSATIAGP